MITRREPLLWLQLMAVAVIPLELELLRLLLAGPALGPVPALERLLIWGLAVIGPGLLLWRRPADWGSMLLVRLPLPGRSPDQRRISALPQTLALKATLVLGMTLLLLSFWSIDRSALLVTQMSPLANDSRLTALLLAGPLLTLMLWQWQQLWQSIWLLTQPDQAFEKIKPISEAELRDRTVSFGLSILQLPALEWPAPETPDPAPTAAAAGVDDSTADAREPEAAAELADTTEAPKADALEADDPETPASISSEEDEPELRATDDPSSRSETAAEPEELETGESGTDTPKDNADASPELTDTAEAPKADALEAEDPETPASISSEEDGPALSATDDLSSRPEAAAEPDSAEPDQSEPEEPEPEQPETEEPKTDDPAADAEPSQEPADSADDAESLKSAVSGSIEPEQEAEEDDGPDLDGEVTDDNLIPGGEAEGHHKKA